MNYIYWEKYETQSSKLPRCSKTLSDGNLHPTDDCGTLLYGQRDWYPNKTYLPDFRFGFSFFFSGAPGWRILVKIQMWPSLAHSPDPSTHIEDRVLNNILEQ